MKINIKSVHNHGDYQKEYVTLEVTETCDAGRFLLADTTYTADGKYSSKLRHTYWFPDGEVKKGDKLIVYTRPGTNSATKNSDGSTTHSFFWQLKVAVWNDDKDCACLIEASTWQFRNVKGN